MLIPGTAQLTARDILHRLQTSKAKCVVTDESLATLLDSVAPQCSSLKSKLLVSPKNREGWLNFGELLRWAFVVYCNTVFISTYVFSVVVCAEELNLTLLSTSQNSHFFICISCNVLHSREEQNDWP